TRNRRPMAYVWSKREGAEYDVPGPHTRGAIHITPTTHPPVPILPGVEALQRATGGTRRLMKVPILLERKRKKSPKGRTLALLINQFLFGGEREALQVPGAFDARKIQTGSARFLLIELVGSHLADESAKPFVLQGAQFVGGEHLKLAIVEVHFVFHAQLNPQSLERSPKVCWIKVTATTAAVSVLNIRGPRVTDLYPNSFRSSSSSRLHPPSGPFNAP